MKSLIKKRLGLTAEVLKGFRGNTRACLAVEPLWGIPYNLYIPYASLYMLALGVSDTRIGTITATGLVFQMLFALSGGFITDKLGRKRTSLIFDFLAWSVPTLIWAVARNYYYFLAAAVLNAMVRIVQNSWNCLMIEDAPPSQRVHIYTWVEVANIMAGFFAPLAGFFVLKFSLVPATRGLYVFAFLSMTVMFLLRNAFTRETAVGLVKMAETKHHTLLDGLREYPAILVHVFREPQTLAAFMMAVLNNVHIVLKNTFLGIILYRGLGLSQESLAIFPAVGAGAAMLIHIFVMPSLGKLDPKRPLFFGLLSLVLCYGLLLFAHPGSYAAAFAASLAGGVGAAVVTPFVNGTLANRVRDDHRAKAMALVYAGVYGGTAPFGYLAGRLSAVNPRLPAALLILVFAGSIFCLFVLKSVEKKAARLARTAAV